MYRASLIGFSLAATIACVVLLVSGVGLMRGTRRGWLLGLGWAIFSLIGPVLEFVTDYVLVGHRLLIEAGRAGNEDAFWEDILGLVVYLVYGGLMMIYPAVLLYVLLKPDVRRAFAKPNESEIAQVHSLPGSIL